MKHMFLEKFFPTSRTATIRKEICGIRQHSGETLHEYWERFNKLCATCPHHQISEQLLIQYFYEGLMMMDQSMIDAASGGALMDKTRVATRHLISNMASNTQQFGTRGTIAPIMVNEIGTIDNPRLENQLTELTSLVRQFAIGQHQSIAAVKACDICTSMEHLTDICPTLQETEPDHPESVGAIGGYQYEKQLPTIRTTTIPRAVCSSRIQFKSEHAAELRQLSIIESETPGAPVPTATTSTGFGNLPSQTIPNPRRNVSVVSLRSGKELQAAPQQKLRSVNTESKSYADSQPSQQGSPTPVPFPSRTLSARKPELDEELLKMFRKMEINIPLLDAIKQLPKYAKFLKELCVHKRKKLKRGVELGGNQK
ncbi:hypothetical protein CR513_11449, partial [Mucuna pruriens]